MNAEHIAPADAVERGSIFPEGLGPARLSLALGEQNKRDMKMAAARTWYRMLLTGILVLSSTVIFAGELTPFWNLVGIEKVHEKISVGLNIKGGDEFQIDTKKVREIIENALDTVGVKTSGSGIGTPMVGITISGESTGGGGACYRVVLAVRATISSPFAKNRSVDAILWICEASGDEVMRYDPASEGFVKPKSQINERVYASVHEVASRLADHFKRAKAN